MNQNSIKVGVLEDNQVMNDYLCHLINQSSLLELAFSAQTLQSAFLQHSENPLDICLVDLDLPDGSGVDFIKHLNKEAPTTSLVLTILGDKTSVLTAFSAGANGYLLKDTRPEQIIEHILSAVNGESPISPQAASHLLKVFNSEISNQSAPNEKQKEKGKELKQNSSDILSQREKDTLLSFSKGLTYKETAEVLGISIHTVNDYVKSIYRKLEVHSRNEAVYEAMQLGLLGV